MIPDKETLEKYLSILQMIMRIQDWDIEVSASNPYEMRDKANDVNAWGSCNANVKRNFAEILINKDTKEHQEGDEWYYTFLHELKHVQMRPLYDAVWNLFDFIDMKDYQKEALKDMINGLFESLTERLAREFCEIYPIESLEEGIEEEDGEDNG